MTLGFVEQSFRLIQTIQNQRFEKSIMPCIKSLILSVYFLKLTHKKLFINLMNQHKELEVFIDGIFDDNPIFEKVNF